MVYCHLFSYWISPLKYIIPYDPYQPLLLRTKSFKNPFFPYCINEWNILTVEIRNYKSVSALKILINCEKKKTPLGVKLLTRLSLQFSHLNKQI